MADLTKAQLAKLHPTTISLIEKAKDHLAHRNKAVQSEIDNLDVESASLRSAKKSITSVKAISLIDKELESLKKARALKKSFFTTKKQEFGLLEELVGIHERLFEDKLSVLSGTTLEATYDRALDALEKCAKLPNRPAVVTFFNGLVNDLDRVEKDIKKASLSPKSLKKAISGRSNLTVIDQIEYTVRLVLAIKHVEDTAVSSLPGLIKSPEDTVKTDLPYASKRATLASQCFKSALGELKNSRGYDCDMEMLKMFMSDCANHYQLGLDLLDGDPKKIEVSSSMDTASRENLTDSVWSFVRDSDILSANDYRNAVRARTPSSPKKK